MVSRKKNKGKERKAKKVENEKVERRRRWQRLFSGLDANNVEFSQCDHGCAVISPDDLAVVSFMDDFFIPGSGWSNTLRNLPRIWNHENSRNITISIFLRIGTNLLSLDTFGCDQSQSQTILDATALIAKTILVLENYNKKMSIDAVCFIPSVAAKMRDITNGNIRDTVKFFFKHISCSCLKDMHSWARKTLPKMGKCFHCNVVNERAQLSVCGRCKIDQYCCRECQVSAWPDHERACNSHVSVNAQLTSRIDTDTTT